MANVRKRKLRTTGIGVGLGVLAVTGIGIGVSQAASASGNGGDNPEAYSRKVLVNLAIDRTRKLKRGRDLPVGDAADLDLLGGARSAPATATAGAGDVDADGDLAAGLAALPARQRAVVVLRYWCDLDEREIADTLGISAGSVKTHASRALKALHSRLTSTSEVPR